MSRHDYDHAAALVIYLGLEPPNRTYVQVARRVGCNPATVAKWAKRYHWDEQLQAAMARGVRKALKSREELTAQAVRIYSNAAQLVDDALDPDDPKLSLEQVFARFPEIHRIYRLEIGEATDQVAVAEVQAGFRTVLSVAVDEQASTVADVLERYAKEVPLAVRERLEKSLIGVFKERLLAAVNEALALGAGGGNV